MRERKMVMNIQENDSKNELIEFPNGPGHLSMMHVTMVMW